jgi:hypothetical protein
MRKVTLKAKKAYFEKTRQANYQASMKLEGIRLDQLGSSSISNTHSSTQTVLGKHKADK